MFKTIRLGIKIDEDIKKGIFLFGEDVKEYTGIDEYDHLCAEYLKDINEDKTLCVVKDTIKVKDKK